MIAALARRRHRLNQQHERRILAALLLHHTLGLDPPARWPLMQSTCLSAAAMHVQLARLETECVVAGEWQQPDPDQPRRRSYRLTDTGRAYAAEQVAAWLQGRETP